MGANEDHLKTILNDDAFRINELKALKGSLDELSTSLRTLSEPGWEGTSAEAAVGLFDDLASSFTEVSGLVAQIETAIDGANEARITAENKMAKLPSAEVDPFWKDLVGQGQPIKFQIWQLPAESALNFIEEHMAADREKEAGLILDDLRSSLAEQTTTLNTLRKDTTLEKFEAIEPDPPQPSGDIPTYAPQYPAGKLGGKPYTPPEIEGKIWEQPERPPKVDPPIFVSPPIPPNFPQPEVIDCGPWPEDPNVDDGGDGTIPGPGTGTGTGGTTGGGGGMLPGLLGGGAGAAAIGVGARLAGSGFGGLGGGGLGGGLGAGGMSSGGLLGGSSPAAAAGARGGAVAGAAGGGRGNTAMMGGGGGAASEKEKRSGLGGIIAPRLEDEDDASPRSAGAGAGGRDQPSE